MDRKSGLGFATRLRWRLPWYIATAAVLVIWLTLAVASAVSLGTGVTSQSIRGCSGVPEDITSGSHACN